MKKTILLIAAALLAVFAVVGAGCIGADPIVGEWTISGGAEPLPTIIFNDDGTGTISLHLFGGISINEELTWSKVEGYENQYKITTTEKTFPLGEYIISEDGMTLKGPITLTKVVEE
ncbi:MAG: hypothetical protein IKW56_00840 [Methanocorpusculum sp.]|nr:hypothetical protein [Methanocorpusculum sp.]